MGERDRAGAGALQKQQQEHPHLGIRGTKVVVRRSTNLTTFGPRPADVCPLLQHMRPPRIVLGGARPEGVCLCY